MLGQATTTAAAGSLDSTLNSTNDAFLGELETTNGGAVASESAQFVLSSIGFNIVRMDMPSYWYEALANVLAAGTVYKLYYPNYQIFTCQPSTNKSGTTRFSLTTRLLYRNIPSGKQRHNINCFKLFYSWCNKWRIWKCCIYGGSFN